MYYTGNYKENDSIQKELTSLKATKTNGNWGNTDYLFLNSVADSNG